MHRLLTLVLCCISTNAAAEGPFLGGVRADTYFPSLRTAPPITQYIKDKGGLTIDGTFVCKGSLGLVKISANLDVEAEIDRRTSLARAAPAASSAWKTPPAAVKWWRSKCWSAGAASARGATACAR